MTRPGYQRPSGPCRRTNCNSPSRRRGLCQTHYYAYLRIEAAKHGTPRGSQPAQPISDHIRALSKAGIGHRRLGELTGIPPQCVYRIHRQQFVYQITAQKILSVPIPTGAADVHAGHAYINAVGTARRLRALIAIGHTQSSLSSLLDDYDQTLISELVTGKRKHVTAGVARRVDDLFQWLQFTPGPSNFARSRAKRNAWPPSFAWDESAIDDPSAEPDWSVLAEPPRRAVPVDFVEIVADHRELGHSDEYIADSMGLVLKTFQRRLCRADIPIRSAAS